MLDNLGETKFSDEEKTDSTYLNETILLAIPPKKNQKRYNFKQMLDYCEENKKEIKNLTLEEKQKFVI